MNTRSRSTPVKESTILHTPSGVKNYDQTRANQQAEKAMQLYWCPNCKCQIHETLKQHLAWYHRRFVLYFECNGSLDERNTLADQITFSPIDMTGGQAVFEDGDLQSFGDQLVCAARGSGIKFYRICRMVDPGLGLCFPESWLINGIAYGVFQEYHIPADLKFVTESSHGEDSLK